MDLNKRNKTLEMLKSNPIEALRNMDSSFLDDDWILYEIVTNPRVYSAIFSLELRDKWKDKDWIILAITVQGYSKIRDFIRNSGVADEKILDDKEILLKALEVDRNFSIEYVSEELKADKEFVLEAIKRRPNSIKYASEKLRTNREFILEAVRQTPIVMNLVIETFKDDREIAIEALRRWKF